MLYRDDLGNFYVVDYPLYWELVNGASNYSILPEDYPEYEKFATAGFRMWAAAWMMVHSGQVIPCVYGRPANYPNNVIMPPVMPLLLPENDDAYIIPKNWEFIATIKG